MQLAIAQESKASMASWMLALEAGLVAPLIPVLVCKEIILPFFLPYGVGFLYTPRNVHYKRACFLVHSAPREFQRAQGRTRKADAEGKTTQQCPSQLHSRWDLGVCG